MTAIDRTAYPRFTRTPSAKELHDLYTPTPDEEAFVATHARGPAQKLALMILLKVYQRLDYFPAPHTIPGAVITHLRSAMHLNADLAPDMSPATQYRYYAAIRERLEVIYQGQQVRRIAAQAMYTAAQVMDNPADLISAAIEVLLKEHCELPAFSTLDRMAWRLRRLVNGGIYQTVLGRLSPEQQRALERLLESEGAAPFTPFNRIKEAPKSAPLTHLDDWLSRLIWLESLGDMEPLLAGIRPAKITHLAEEARSLHATNLWDFTAPKRLTLLVCLIRQATISTRDEIAQTFIKRMRKLTERAKEELERVRGAERETTEHLIEVLTEVLHASLETQNPTDTAIQVRQVFDGAGGAAHLLEECEQVRGLASFLTSCYNVPDNFIRCAALSDSRLLDEATR